MRTIGIILLSLFLVTSCDDGSEGPEDVITFIVTGNEFESEDDYTIFYYEYSIYPGEPFGPEDMLGSEDGVPFKYLFKLFNGDIVVQYPSYMRLVTATALQPCDNCATIEPDEHIQVRTISDEQKYTQYSIRFEE
jgi:hypothetical protein